MSSTDLLRPEAYESLRPSRVELQETHLSQVFVLDHDVFKIKKPVFLGFADFRTLDQRRTACLSEVTLNARLAPDVYYGVVPVCLDESGRRRLAGPGPVVDWAVHMRKLSHDRRADVLLARGELTPGAIDVIAGHIVAFHASARADKETASFGTPAAIARNVEENFAQTEGVIEVYAPEAAAEIVRWQTAFLKNNAQLFESRVAAGRVRDGHGDLRLEHVYLEEGRDRPTIIDCIEFSDRFRFADVCADIAFLSMDLEAHGRGDLSERLLARYAREANDFDLYAVVDFWESYRAFIRAKVAAILDADESVDESTRAQADRQARRHFLLALAEARQPVLPAVVVAVGGVIASGKSTIAERIADERSAPLVNADRTRKSMLGVGAHQPVHEDAWSGAYDHAFTARVYEEVMRRAGIVLASGRPVVIDASFRSVALRETARRVALAYGVPFLFVECRAAAAVCRERLALREKAASVSDGRLALFDEFCAHFESVTELLPSEHVVVDTGRPIEESVREVQGRIDMWPRGLLA